MGRRNRFVKPKTIIVEISDGDTIEIKKELNVGELKEMSSAGLKHVSAGDNNAPRFEFDSAATAFAKVTQYLVGWSFEEEDEKGDVIPIELTEDAVRSLDEATYDEIVKAIDEHTEKLEKEKNAASGKTKPKQKSRS